jgi:site-specific recombinase XerD
MSTSAAKTGYHHNAKLVESFTRWLSRHKVAQESTRAYLSDIRHFLRFMDSSLSPRDPSAFDNVGTSQIEAYRRHLAEAGLHSSTIKRNLVAIRKFFDFLLQEKLVETNPVAGVMPSHLLKDVIPTEGLIEMFAYMTAQQASPDDSTSLRYRRNELLLICLVLFGIRICQIPRLKPSCIGRTGNAICLRVSENHSVDLHVAFLIKLREYLTLRRSPVDVLFLEPHSKRAVSSRSLHALFVELSFALRVTCTPASLYRTYRHLCTSPHELRRIWQSLCPTSNGSLGTDGSIVPKLSAPPPPSLGREGRGVRVDSQIQNSGPSIHLSEF